MKYNHRFLVLDTETGGLLSKGKEATIDIALTEIGVVVVDSESLEIINEHSWLIKP
jgi:DNA polymerase III epsilon subunit-like protein